VLDCDAVVLLSRLPKVGQTRPLVFLPQAGQVHPGTLGVDEFAAAHPTSQLGLEVFGVAAAVEGA